MRCGNEFLGPKKEKRSQNTSKVKKFIFYKQADIGINNYIGISNFTLISKGGNIAL
jgi:hypothetical protein